MNGVFYEKVYLKSEGHDIIFDFNTRNVVCSKNAMSYFQFDTSIMHNDCINNNKYEKSEQIQNFHIKWNHSKHGNLNLKLSFFSNPQIKYGIISLEKA